jgi:hypothetical protein
VTVRALVDGKPVYGQTIDLRTQVDVRRIT